MLTVPILPCTAVLLSIICPKAVLGLYMAAIGCRYNVLLGSSCEAMSF